MEADSGGEVIARHRTAMSRRSLSKPMRLALAADVITESTDVLDYGCGKADDVRELQARGFACSGWDPAFRNAVEPSPADVVNLGFVVNVIERPAERVEALKAAWRLARKALVVAARLDYQLQGESYRPYGDGYLSAKGTFQKFYTQQELGTWLEATIGVPPVAAGPGVYFLFRDDDRRQAYLSKRRRRTARVPRQCQTDEIYERNRELLTPLLEFVTERGRLPVDDELPDQQVKQIGAAFGSVRRAFTIVAAVTGGEQWQSLRQERTEDLLVFLALQRFGGRPRFKELARELSNDVKAFFGTYRKACDRADELLFAAGDAARVDRACRAAGCGKLTNEALYVHASALSRLPVELRIYEGCAAAYVGSVAEANVLKLKRREPQISYLSYPRFDNTAHPALAEALVVTLNSLDIRYYDYSARDNPPILHRKEELIADDYPGRDKFRRLTRQEEKRGLYEETRTIGTRKGWEARLDECGVRIEGHRVRTVVG